MKIAVIACEMLKREFEELIDGDEEIVHIEYLDYALHSDPECLKAKIEHRVHKLEGKVDAILLGYGTCKALKNIEYGLNVPTVRLEGDDCIEILLRPGEYLKELNKCAGTWFAIPSIAERGHDYLEKSLNLEGYENEDYDAKFIIDLVFQNYSRCLFIDTGLKGNEELKERSKEFAVAHNLRHESRCGTVENIFIGLEKVRRVAESAPSTAAAPSCASQSQMDRTGPESGSK